MHPTGVTLHAGALSNEADNSGTQFTFYVHDLSHSWIN